jgi:CBS domain-containing protein
MRTKAPFPLSRTLDGNVQDIMTTGVVSLPATAPLRSVHEAIVAHDVHAVLIVEPADSTPRGWITTHGLLVWAGKVGSMRNARSAISEPVRWLTPESSIREAAHLMVAADVSHILVAEREGSAPLGVVADADIVRLESLH